MGYLALGCCASVELELQRILAVFEVAEQVLDIRVADRFAGIIGNQILLRHIGHVVALIVLGQKVIERLVLRRAAFLWNGVIPLLGIGKNSVHIENNPPKRVFAMPDHLAQPILCTCL